MALLPLREVMSIMENNEAVEAKCEFCGRVYTLEHSAIQKQVDERIAAAAENGGDDMDALQGAYLEAEQ